MLSMGGCCGNNLMISLSSEIIETGNSWLLGLNTGCWDLILACHLLYLEAVHNWDSWLHMSSQYELM